MYYKLIYDYNGKEGIGYFEQLLPESCHAIAGYTGVSFANTLRMLYYDLKNGQIVKLPDLSGMERIVMLNSQGQLVGAAVSHYIPQFCYALDYEQYLIIAAENAYIFFRMLYKVRKSVPKFELITFREKERKFIAHTRLLSDCKDIHYWHLYRITPFDSSISARRTNFLPVLPNSYISVEAMPHRYLAFANAGLSEYNVMVLSDINDEPIAICSLLPYTTNQRELKLWYRNDAANCPREIASFLQKAVYETMGLQGCAIWRIKNPTDIEQAIIKEGRFICVGQEEHYHLVSDLRDTILMEDS